jgi:hypothetical protein
MLICGMGLLDFFKSKQRSVKLSVLPLRGDGYCAVVGESHYQEALGGTAGLCSLDENGERVFQAFLVREPDNPYDSNAIAVYSSHGQLGYLSRENAEAYLDVLEELAERGYDGGACDAILRGGTPDKPSYGVVLRLADPDSCYADLIGEAGGDTTENDEERSGPGFVRGRHYTEYFEEVKELRRSGREEEAESLLLELVEATEAEANSQGLGVAPAYYEQLAILYRSRGDGAREVSILERFAQQKHAPGAMPPRLLERLEKARTRLGTARE